MRGFELESAEVEIEEAREECADALGWSLDDWYRAADDLACAEVEGAEDKGSNYAHAATRLRRAGLAAYSYAGRPLPAAVGVQVMRAANRIDNDARCTQRILGTLLYDAADAVLKVRGMGEG